MPPIYTSLSSIDVDNFTRAVELYKAISSRESKLFLARTLSYSKRQWSRYFRNKVARKSVPLDQECATIKQPKSSELFNVLSTSKPPLRETQLKGLEIRLDNLEIGIESDIAADVEIEAAIVKLNGTFHHQTLSNAINTYKLGVYSVEKINQSGSSGRKGSSRITIPLDAFRPLNGHCNWCSWLVLRCRWLSSMKNERSFRCLGHRQRMSWSPVQTVNRIAAVLLCNSGKPVALEPEMTLSLWPARRANDDVLPVLKKTFSDSLNKKSAKVLADESIECCLTVKIDQKISTNSNDYPSSEFFKRQQLDKRLDDVSLFNSSNSSKSVLSSRINNSINGGHKVHHKSQDSPTCSNVKPTLPNPRTEPVYLTNEVPKDVTFRFYSLELPKDDSSEGKNFSGETSANLPELSNCSLSQPRLFKLSTVAQDSKRCPFCATLVEDLYFLLKHLRLCHSRFVFYYRESHRYSMKKHIIDVAANSMLEDDAQKYYPYFYHSRMHRVRRKQTATLKEEPRNFLTFKRPLHHNTLLERSLCEFKARDKGDALVIQDSAHVPAVRQYFHSQTCIPILPNEYHDDSEDEVDPEWLRVLRCKLIDEFTDVNDGEKRILKMWNLHVMKYNLFGDDHMYGACCSFLNNHGQELMDDGGLLNFALHLTNLYIYGLLSQRQVSSLLALLHSYGRRDL